MTNKKGLIIDVSFIRCTKIIYQNRSQPNKNETNAKTKQK
jgi:hypothetical protein